MNKTIHLWNASINDWKNPGRSLNTLPLSVFKNLCGSGILSDEYVPEPYYVHDLNEIKFVILNLNPGNSSSEDILKKHSYQGAYMYNDLLSMNYFEWQDKYSPFKNGQATSIPGVLWWRGKRLNWLKRFSVGTPAGKLAYVNDYYPILAAELCPLHSLKWTTSTVINTILSNPNYMKDVIEPVLLQIPLSGNRYGIAFGKDNYNILQEMGFDVIFHIFADGSSVKINPNVSGVFTQSDISSLNKVWPSNAKGNKTKWSYAFLHKKMEDQDIYVLCLYVSGSLNAPAVTMSAAEVIIKDVINRII